ncbi:hypothetical protein NQ318_022108 [Aromia moschata]|uniref:Uncharacterized protein n=1 Tax=Aromia moschata TaxID=1265417 RepID=A0AAV8Z7N8_9CUCU|nr:hypothetical protein NQ318_022108 [Aromia moschata]
MCPKRNKLFCFICLVMGGNQSAWTQEGSMFFKISWIFTVLCVKQCYFPFQFRLYMGPESVLQRRVGHESDKDITDYEIRYIFDGRTYERP